MKIKDGFLKKYVMSSKSVFSFVFLLFLRQQTQTTDAMKIYKWMRRLMKASALTTVMFVMQACYGSPNMPPEMPEETEFIGEEEMELPVSDTLSIQKSL